MFNLYIFVPCLGSRALEDSGTVEKRKETVQEKPCGGKGPNRHVIDSYGAGENVIAWIKGEYVKTHCTTTHHFY